MQFKVINIFCISFSLNSPIIFYVKLKIFIEELLEIYGNRFDRDTNGGTA